MQINKAVNPKQIKKIIALKIILLNKTDDLIA